MFTLIIGPMKSAKSLDLIAQTEKHKYAGKKVVYIKPIRDARSNSVKSRLGIEVEAIELKSLMDAPDADVLAVDEVHMFPEASTYGAVSMWLTLGKEVICSGLNTDHAGRLMPTVARLLELSPEVLINKQAVCEVCAKPATHTQVMTGNTVVPKSLSPELPDDGTYLYSAVCRSCFK